MNRTTVLRLALLGALVLLLVVPAAGYAGQSKKAAPQSSQASCQLQVFSWWTGGGEAAGLTKLIGIWNKSNPSCKFKNETVVVFWKDDHVKVMLYTAYKRIISATIPEDGFPACHRKGGRGG